MSFPPPTAKQASVIWMALTGLAVAAIVALVAGAVWSFAWVINVFANVLWPLAVAGVIAYLLDPVVDFLGCRKVPRTRAVAIVFVFAFLIVVGVLGSVIPRIVTETQELQARIPAFSTNLQQKVKMWVEHPPAPIANLLRRFQQREAPAVQPADETPPDTNAPPATVAGSTGTTGQPDNSLLNLVDDDTMKRITGWMGEVMREFGAWLKRRASGLASFFGVLAGLVLIPIYAFYFLVEKRGISANWQDYLPVKDSRFKQELVFVLSAINEYLIAFFRGQVLVAMCDGVPHP